MVDRLYFEDVEFGMSFVSHSRLILESDIAGFAELSGDRHPIHVDPAYAATTPFARVIAHGPFGIAMAIGFFQTFEAFQDTALMMTSINNWRFIAPMFIGDLIRMEMTIGAKRLSRSGHGFVDRSFRLLNGQHAVIQEGSSEMIMLRRDAAP